MSRTTIAPAPAQPALRLWSRPDFTRAWEDRTDEGQRLRRLIGSNLAHLRRLLDDFNATGFQAIAAETLEEIQAFETKTNAHIGCHLEVYFLSGGDFKDIERHLTDALRIYSPSYPDWLASRVTVARTHSPTPPRRKKAVA